MPARSKYVVLSGLVLIPIAAYYFPYLPELVGAVLAAVMIVAKPGSPAIELGITRPHSIARALFIGVTAGVVLFLINRLALTPVIEQITGLRRDLSAFDYLRGNFRGLAALLPVVWVLAGICEELVYRAYLVGQASWLLGNSRLVQFVAVAFAAVVFALAHGYQGLTGMLVTGTLAVLFGLLYLQQRGNLWANMVAHIVADTVSLSAIAANWDRPLDAMARSLLFGE